MYQYTLDPPLTSCLLRTEAAILLLKNHMISKLESLVPQENITSEPSDTFCDLGTTVSTPKEFSRVISFSRHEHIRKINRLIRLLYSILSLCLLWKLFKWLLFLKLLLQQNMNNSKLVLLKMSYFILEKIWICLWKKWYNVCVCACSYACTLFYGLSLTNSGLSLTNFGLLVYDNNTFINISIVSFDTDVPGLTLELLLGGLCWIKLHTLSFPGLRYQNIIPVLKCENYSNVIFKNFVWLTNYNHNDNRNKDNYNSHNYSNNSSTW